MVNIIKNSQVVDTSSDVFISSEIFRNNSNVKNVNLSDYKFNNSDASMAFANCSNLTSVSNISNDTTNIEGMFYNCSSLVDAPTLPNSISGKTYYMNGLMYKGYSTKFNVSVYYGNMTNQFYMNPDNSIRTVYYINSQGNFQSVGTASEVYDDYIVFTVSSDYTQTTTSADRNTLIDTANPSESSIYGLYQNCSSLVNASIVSDNITNIKYTFNNCYNLKNVEINCSKVSDFSNVFYNCSNLTNINLSSNNVESLNSIFSGFTNLKNVSLNMPNLKSMSSTFSSCSNLTNISEIPNSVTNMYGTFQSCSNLTNISEIPNSVANMSYTFYSCYNLTTAPEIPNSVTSMYQTFGYCNNLVNLPEIPNSVTNMSYTFYNCTNLTDVSEIPDGVTDLSWTFYNCYNIHNASYISNSVINMSQTFYNCTNLVTIPEFGSNVTNMYRTFYNCRNISGDIVIASSNVTNTYSIFNLSSLEKNVYIPFTTGENITLYAWQTYDYYGSYPQYLYTKTESPTRYASGQLFYENGADFTLSTIDYVSSNSYFYLQSGSDYSRYPSKDMTGGLSTSTYSAFKSAGYSNTSRIDGVLLKDYNEEILISDWTYEKDNDIRVLYNYIGEETNISLKTYKTTLHDYESGVSLGFTNNTNILSVDMKNVSIINNSLAYMFYNCSNLSSVNNINTNVTNYSHAFDGTNISGDVIYGDEIINVSGIYDNTVLNKDVYINYTYDNGINTPTYDTFLEAGYSTTERKDGVQLFSFMDYADKYYWEYTPLANNKRLLTNYIKNDTVIRVPSDGVINDTSLTPFANKNFEKINLNEVEFINNTMNYTFNNCQNLAIITNINNNVSNMINTFYNCRNLVNAPEIPNSVTNMYSTFFACLNLVNAPEIPNSVVDMSYTFFDCYNLIDAPEIPNSVTNMYRTFEYCNNLANAPIFGNSVTDMYQTFCYCNNLINVPEIPNSVTNMYRTFEGCRNLVNAPVIPNSVTNITNTFSGCSNLVNAPEISNNVTNMAGTFSGCSNLVNAPVIPNSVIRLYQTFWGCSNLVNAPVIPNSVTDMSWSFYDCSNLVNAPVIPDSVTNISWSFENCSNLVNAPVIPDSVTDLWASFYNCSNLVNAPAIPDNANNIGMIFYNCSNLVNAPVIPNSVTSIYSSFSGCSNLVNAPVIPNSVTNMEQAFRNCSNLVNIPMISNSVNRFANAFSGCSNLVNIPEFEANINISSMDGSFSDCSKLVNTGILPENVIYMNNTFANCSNLTEIGSIPTTVLYMNNTFANCSNLTEIDPVLSMSTISSSSSTLYMNYTFSNCVNLTNVPDFNINSNINISLNGTFSNCVNLTNVGKLPNKLGYDGLRNTFADCYNLVNAPEIPEGVTSMYYTFVNCYNLRGDIVIRSSNIYDYQLSGVFDNTTLEKNVYIPFKYENGVYTQTYNAFIQYGGYSTTTRKNGALICDYQTYLLNKDWQYQNVANGYTVLMNYIGNSSDTTLPQSNTVLHDYESGVSLGFTNNENIVNIDLSNVSIINNSLAYMFYNCPNLESVTNYNMYSITNYAHAFDGTNITRETLFNDEVTDVTGIYSNTSTIKNAYMNYTYLNGINTNAYNAFLNAGYSTDVVKDGTLIKPYQEYADKYFWVYNTVNENGMTYKYVYNYIGNEVNLVVPNNQNYTIEKIQNNKIKSIDLNSVPFKYNKINQLFPSSTSNIINVTNINENVVNMSSAFYYCYNLVNVPTIPNSVINLDSAFYYCRNLVNAPVIPNSVTNMCNTFSGCTNLVNSLVMSNSVTNMCFAYNNCSNLTGTPIISNSIINMYYSYYNCSNISGNIIIDSPHLRDLRYAFVNDNKITSIFINSTTVNNATNLLNGTSSTKTIYIPFSVNIPENLYGWSKSFSSYEGPDLLYSKNLSIEAETYGQFYYEDGTNYPNDYVNWVSGTYVQINGVQYGRDANSDLIAGNQTTRTYNAFINAGYSTTSRKDGAILKDNKIGFVTFNITPDSEIYLNGEKVLNNTKTICQTENDYMIYNSSLPLYIDTFNCSISEEKTITKNISTLTGHTITIDTGMTGCDVKFIINNIELDSNNSGTTYSISIAECNQLTVGYRIKKSGYTTLNSNVTFNNEDININVTMVTAPWISWTRPNLTSNGTLGGNSFAVQASNEMNSSYAAYKAVDGNSSTYWWSNYGSSGTTKTYTMYNPNPLKMTQIVMSYDSSYKPKAVTIQGSNNNSSWSTITSNFSAGTSSGTLTLTNSTAYKYYKITLTINSSYIQIKEFTITATYQAE